MGKLASVDALREAMKTHDWIHGLPRNDVLKIENTYRSPYEVALIIAEHFSLPRLDRRATEA
jgi:hypothetical protein